jgi:hypothetical protein
MKFDQKVITIDMDVLLPVCAWLLIPVLISQNMELQVLLFHDNQVHTYFLSSCVLLSQLLFNKCILAICMRSLSIFNIVLVDPYRNS